MKSELKFNYNHITFPAKKDVESAVEGFASYCEAADVHWCDGSEDEFHYLCNKLENRGTFVKLNTEKRPNSYACFTDQDDIAGLDDRIFICSRLKRDAGPTNNWMAPKQMKSMLNDLMAGCMGGRVLYVIPFCMGPVGSRFSKYGIQLTDSEYVVVSMRIMSRIGEDIYPYLEKDNYVECIHTLGAPLKPGEEDKTWPCNPKTKYIAHFPEERIIISYGSGHGDNSILGSKGFSLRIGSALGREDLWLAEHMSITGVTSPEGKKTYLAAAFPGAHDKTNFFMLIPAKGLEDWKVTTVGDDIAWIQLHQDGRLLAVNPEAGYSGVVSGTNPTTNPNAMEMIKANTIFTNVALTPDGDVWWEGLTSQRPEGLVDWRGNTWDRLNGQPAAHPDSWYMVPAKQNPVIDQEWDNPEGVHIEGFVFAGSRSRVAPLVYQSFNWNFGVYLAATMGSEMAETAFGEIGKIRRDPFAMLHFVGYHIADYLDYWLQFGRELPNAPRIFGVNWSGKDEQGKFLWPGSGENIRVLKWVVERIQGKASSVERSIGWVPAYEDFDWTGLDSKDNLNKMMDINPVDWKKELSDHEELFSKIYDKLPKEFFFMRVLLLSSLWRSPGKWGKTIELKTRSEAQTDKCKVNNNVLRI